MHECSISQPSFAFLKASGPGKTLASQEFPAIELVGALLRTTTTTTGGASAGRSPTPYSEVGQGRPIAREDLEHRGRLGCPLPSARRRGRPARRHATQGTEQSAPIPPQRLKTGRCESGEGGYFGLSQTPATRRSAPGHAESRAKLLDDEGQPKQPNKTSSDRAEACRPPSATAGAAPTRTGTT